MQEIKAIIFDLGRVLINVDISRGIFAFLQQGLEGNVDKIVENIMKYSTYKDFNKGRISKSDFYEQMKNEFHFDISFEYFCKSWCDIFSARPKMQELVSQLNERYPLGLLSDTDTLHWNYIKDTFPVVRYFKNPTLSFEAGYAKPEKQIYEIAAKNVRTPIKNCLFIDDLQRNVDGAIAVGMNAIKFQNAQLLKEKLRKWRIYE